MKKEFTVRLREGSSLQLGRRTLVVGVLNVTPDSFSNSGEHFDRERAIDAALLMESQGADIIEVGGESTRPGSIRIPAREEIERIEPVLKALGRTLRIPISVDTYKSDVARVAFDNGAAIINDVSALRFDTELPRVVADAGAALVLMHMRGEPGTMQQIEPSPDIILEIERDLGNAVAKAISAGIDRDRLILDPGIGFGKTLGQNLEILNHLNRIASLGFPLMIGTSRKSFIGKLTGRAVGERLSGTAASVTAAVLGGAHLVRAHDVEAMVDVCRVADAIRDG